MFILRRLICLTLLGLLTLSACATPSPTPRFTPGATVEAGTPAPPTATPTPAPTLTPSPTPTPVPIELVVCQSHEPTSLYYFSDDTAARAAIFDALYDGPIESVGYAYQPTILETLPSLENGDAALSTVTVNPGDTVVDVAIGAVTPLTAGVTLAQPDGSWLVYTGTEPAQTVQVSAIFRLRPGLLWADGQPLTAGDSLFAYQIAAQPKTPVSKFAIHRTATYEALDDLTTRWAGLPGWLDTEFSLRFWAPFPRHVYATYTAEQLLTLPQAAEQPLGWGAFALREWVRGDHLTLTRNPNYFRASEGLPHVDLVTYRFGLESEQIIAELLAGRCDIGAVSADFRIQIPALLDAQTAGTLAPQFTSSTIFEHLDFGILPADDYDRALGQELFQDARLRQAIAYCLNRPALVNEFLYGLAEIPDTYIPRAHPLFAGEAVVRYAFDPARGQALLEELGWRDSDGDGVRDNGRRRLALTYVSGPPGSAFREALAGALQAQLRDHCGIALAPSLLPPEELYEVWPTGPLFGRQFDLGGFSWRVGIEPQCGLYLTDAIPGDQNPGGVNNTGYSNPAFDAACHAAQNTLSASARAAHHAEAQIIFSQDLPSLPLFLQLKVGVARPGITGYAVNATANSDLWNVEQISK